MLTQRALLQVWVCARTSARTKQLARWLRDAGVEVSAEEGLTEGAALLAALGEAPQRVAVVMDELLADGHGLQTLYQLLIKGVPVVMLTPSRSSDVWVEAWRGGALDCLPWPGQGAQEVDEVMGAIKRALAAYARQPQLAGHLRALPSTVARGPFSDGQSQTLVMLIGPRAVDGLMQAMSAWPSASRDGIHSCVVCVDALHRSLRPALFQALGLHGFWNHHGLMTAEGLRAGFHVLTARELCAWVPALQDEAPPWPAPPRAWVEPLLSQLAPMGLAQVLLVAHGDLDPEDEAMTQALLRQDIALAQFTGHDYRFFDQADAQPLLLESEALWSTILLGGGAQAPSGGGGGGGALARWTAHS